MYGLTAIIILFGMLLRSTIGRPLENDVQILKYDSDVRSDGYDFAFETSDGTKRDETGVLDGNGALAVRGSFSYIGDDGVTYTVNFIADENGYQPEGAHIPKTKTTHSSENPDGFALGLPPSAVLSLVG